MPPGGLTFPVRHVLLRWGPWWHRSSLNPMKVPTWLVTAFICSQNSRIVFGDVSSHRMKKRRVLCRSGSGCCRRFFSVTTSPNFFGVGRRSWGVMVTIWNNNILVRKPKGWGASLVWFYLSIFNDSWVKGTVPARKRSSNLLKRLRKIFAMPVRPRSATEIRYNIIFPP